MTKIGQSIERVMDEIRDEFVGALCSKKTMDRIIFLLKFKLDSSVKIKCDYENNPPDVINSGEILVHLEWYENGKYYHCDISFGETLSLRDYRDAQINKILNK